MQHNKLQSTTRMRGKTLGKFWENLPPNLPLTGDVLTAPSPAHTRKERRSKRKSRSSLNQPRFVRSTKHSLKSINGKFPRSSFSDGGNQSRRIKKKERQGKRRYKRSQDTQRRRGWKFRKRRGFLDKDGKVRKRIWRRRHLQFSGFCVGLLLSDLKLGWGWARFLQDYRHKQRSWNKSKRTQTEDGIRFFVAELYWRSQVVRTSEYNTLATIKSTTRNRRKERKEEDNGRRLQEPLSEYKDKFSLYPSCKGLHLQSSEWKVIKNWTFMKEKIFLALVRCYLIHLSCTRCCLEKKLDISNSKESNCLPEPIRENKNIRCIHLNDPFLSFAHPFILPLSFCWLLVKDSCAFEWLHICEHSRFEIILHCVQCRTVAMPAWKSKRKKYIDNKYVNWLEVFDPFLISYPCYRNRWRNRSIENDRRKSTDQRNGEDEGEYKTKEDRVKELKSRSQEQKAPTNYVSRLLGEMSSKMVSVGNGSGNNSNEDIQCISPWDLRQAGKFLKVDLIGDNHPMKFFIPRERVHKQVIQCDPSPNSVKSLLEEMKDPSLLSIRGCDQLFLPYAPRFPFERFKTLTSLQISRVSNLTALPENTISEMTQLQGLELSHLPIQHLPDDLFSKLCNLRSIVLKGCSNLHSFPHFEKPDDVTITYLDKLELLDVSHCTALQIKLPPLLCLKMLDLSYICLHKGSLILNYCQTHLFLSGSKQAFDIFIGHNGTPFNLQVLDLSGAYVVDWFLHILRNNFPLVVLDLSRTGIISLKCISHLTHLRNLILRECTRLVQLPEMKSWTDLEVFDISDCKSLEDLPEDLTYLVNLKDLNLSGCVSLKQLREGLFDQMSCLERLNLSSNKISHLPSFANLINLQILNISGTNISKLPDMSKLVNLKELLLANCELLQVFPDVQALVNLETLDVSLGDDYEYPVNNLQVESEIDAQSGQFLSPPSRLQNLVLAKRPGLVKLFPQVSLEKLEYLDIGETNEIDCIGADLSRMGNLQWVIGQDGSIHPTPAERKISKGNDIQLVSTFVSKSSSFDRFKYEFRELEDLITNIQKKFESCFPENFDFTTSNLNLVDHDNSSNGKIQNQLYKRNFAGIYEGLNYVLKHLNRLDSSHNCKSSEMLLKKLFDVATDLSAVDSPLNYKKLNELFRIVAKLKLLVPPEGVDDWKEVKAIESSSSLMYEDYKVIYKDLEEEEIQESYDSLKKNERNCLLCFAVFPNSAGFWNSANIDYLEMWKDFKPFKIKKRTLIQLWIGEGFIDPQHEEENPNSSPKPAPQHASTSKGVERSKTADEIGEQILKVLVEEKLIVSVEILTTWGLHEKYWELPSFYMRPSVHRFVTRRAMEEGFFDFHDENHKLTLTPHLKGSERACFLKSEGIFPSSCQLWSNYTANSSKKLERFKTIHTLFNVNENMICINSEWISKMRNLRVLHLGSLDYENEQRIEVSDLMFMEELKRMKHLRLLSLKGFSAITKLPDSVCKLINLKILNLRDCGYLEELPDGIGSLKQLTHLDITNCHTLSMLPKEVRLLSKLEVLKGFVIYFQTGGRQHKKACTLKDLLKLKSLRKLNLIVNADKFPYIDDLRVLREMLNLCNLKITWEKSYNKDQELPREAWMDSRWQHLKCWDQRAPQNNDAEEQSKIHHMGNLKKMFLYCFPLETAPHWLHPGELPNLEKLYIEGGNLERLLPDTNQSTWNVKNLRMMNLPHFEIDMSVLHATFPNMTLFWHHNMFFSRLGASEDEADEDIMT